MYVFKRRIKKYFFCSSKYILNNNENTLDNNNINNNKRRSIFHTFQISKANFFKNINKTVSPVTNPLLNNTFSIIHCFSLQ